MSFRACAWMFAVFAGLFVMPSTALQAEEKPLAELLPRIPSKSPEEALKTFELQHGFTLELVAGEPLVADPIDAAFDERNRMYVVEMSDYPFLPEQRVQIGEIQRGHHPVIEEEAMRVAACISETQNRVGVVDVTRKHICQSWHGERCEDALIQ